MHYYVYKNGKGNSWSGFTHGHRDGDGHRHLYVGYDDTCDGLVADGRFEPIPVVQQKDMSRADFKDDLLHIMVAAHKDNRARFLLLTFEKDRLCFWRTRGEVQRHEHKSDMWREANKYADKNQVMGSYGYFNDRPIPLPHDKKRTFADLRDEERAFRTLPVELVAEVPRHLLYTSIDSLSVYQYLNRGTCRPFWRISGPTGAEIPAAIRPSGPAGTYPSGKLSTETPFAAFARQYLNEVLWRQVPHEIPTDMPRLGALTGIDYRSLALANFNPILVETAALALVADLGLTPDIGVGKGMDVIDVRARATSEDGTRCLTSAAAAASLLSEILLTAGGTPDVASSQLRDHGVLDIQCKAAQRGTPEPGILYFGFFDKKRREKPDTLFLPSLEKVLAAPRFAGEFRNLRRFLALQSQMIRGTWAGEPAHSSPAARPDASCSATE